MYLEAAIKKLITVLRDSFLRIDFNKMKIILTFFRIF